MNPYKKQGPKKFTEPTQSQLSIVVGDSVVHKFFGYGKVVLDWGSWRACRRCYAQVGECNHHDPIPIDVNGQHTHDVKFEDGLTRSINCVWMTKV